jgi:hypothetical protein
MPPHGGRILRNGHSDAEEAALAALRPRGGRRVAPPICRAGQRSRPSHVRGQARRATSRLRDGAASSAAISARATATASAISRADAAASSARVSLNASAMPPTISRSCMATAPVDQSSQSRGRMRVLEMRSSSVLDGWHLRRRILILQPLAIFRRLTKRSLGHCLASRRFKSAVASLSPAVAAASYGGTSAGSLRRRDDPHKPKCRFPAPTLRIAADAARNRK